MVKLRGICPRCKGAGCPMCGGAGGWKMFPPS